MSTSTSGSSAISIRRRRPPSESAVTGDRRSGCVPTSPRRSSKLTARLNRPLPMAPPHEGRSFSRIARLEVVRLIKERGVSYVQASQDLGVHVSQLRDWVKKFADDPEHAFPGHGQMKPEQLEIARLKREVTKLKAETS